MPKQIQGAQRDFSYGEVDVALKRADDHPARKAGLRQMQNFRILNSNGVQNRPGRSALFPFVGAVRTDEITMSPGNDFKLVFSAGRLSVMNSAGAQVATFASQGNGAALPWTALNTNQIVYAIFGMTITFTFDFAMRPQVVTWDGVSTWTIADYVETVTPGGQKRTPFYRLSPQNVTVLPSAITGVITVKFSSPIVVAGMVGTRIRWAGRQILLGSIIDASTMNGLVIEPLPIAETLSVTGATGTFSLGDVLIGATSGAKAIVCGSPNLQYINAKSLGILFNVGDFVTGGTSGATGRIVSIDSPSSDSFAVSLDTATAFVAFESIIGPGGTRTVASVSGTSILVQHIQTSNVAPAFTTERIAGPSGSATVTSGSTVAPQAIDVWDDEVINAFRGYPASVFVDQFRIGFCDFPPLPGAIGWSAQNSQNDLYVGPNPTDAIFEIAPNKVRIYYVVPGPEGSEFVFCDRRVYYIPISETNPLKPGSVAFKTLSGDGSAQVIPHIAQEAILYINAGKNTVMCVLATGAYLRPFNTRSLTDFHAHLFNNIVCIACPSADGTFNERYAYVLNGDGSIAVGKYTPDTLTSNSPVIGWGPWSGTGVVKWIAAWSADVLFTTSYFGATICEILDDSVYLDAALFVNALPAPFTAPGGKGPLWWIPGQSVNLMDQGTRSMGTYQIDANGFIVPQNNGGENLAAATLVAGQQWTGTIEPFCPDAAPGTDVGQRMKMRQIALFMAYVVNSTGFCMGHLFSSRQTRTSPPLGTLMNSRRIDTWNQDDDPTLPPILRETAESYATQGSSYDPRAVLFKDTPGPLQLLEIGIEVSI